ncbi:helix-turn-helix domain-containing protein [Limosilactobacillus mucosae]|nr:helix-turn-helix domain-containing protein [Limosilactobacillus mucosae]
MADAMKSKFPKISGSGPFFDLNGRKQTVVKAMIEQDLSDKELGNLVGVSDRTIRNWKKDDLMIRAKLQYQQIIAKDTYTPEAVKHIYHLMLNAKSEMVQLQSATTILKMAGMLSDNDTPELTRAKVRKANADARVAEARAKTMEDGSNDAVSLLDRFLDKLEEGDHHGS